MAHIPYGYKIVDGKAVVDEEQAKSVRKLFDGYISGLGLKPAAVNAGLEINHGSAGNMLRNNHYLGNEYYPAIIDEATYYKAEEIRISKAVSLGRVRKLMPSQKPVAETNFTIGIAKKKLKNPFAQAEYVYSLIKSEGEIDG